MKKQKKEAGRFGKMVTKAAGKSLMTVADIFAVLPCDGPWYEVKLPQNLKK